MIEGDYKYISPLLSEQELNLLREQDTYNMVTREKRAYLYETETPQSTYPTPKSPMLCALESALARLKPEDLAWPEAPSLEESGAILSRLEADVAEMRRRGIL